MENEQEPIAFDSVGLIRDLARKAHPDAIPEMIDGLDAEAIAASIEPAKAAYSRLKDELNRSTSTAPVSPTNPPQPAQVPAGGHPPAIDPDRLPASEKIRRGIATQRSH